MGLLSFITGADRAGKVIDKVADGLFSGIDKLKLTEEEKLDYAAAAGKQWLEVQKVLAQENTARTLTRRYIAVAVMYSWLFLVLACFALGFYEALATPALNASVQLLTLLGSVMGATVITIIVFYFGPSAVTSFFQKKDEKTK
jgi:hypothetical protein